MCMCFVIDPNSPLRGEEGELDEETEEKISSPIRVSPDRAKQRTKRSRESDRKLSVKDRLYVSRQTIGMYYMLVVCLSIIMAFHVRRETSSRDKT